MDNLFKNWEIEEGAHDYKMHWFEFWINNGDINLAVISGEDLCECHYKKVAVLMKNSPKLLLALKTVVKLIKPGDTLEPLHEEFTKLIKEIEGS